ncbi:MAG: MarR family winged helix-turn-helix transcriptional regulator, partial [Dehalococcoidia bacterium]|nr:MarR family winged helix-turn-helix transcriptional regulator [Dehalococcoidia bacterium]
SLLGASSESPKDTGAKGTEDILFATWRLLRRTSEIVERARNKELANHGINVRQAATLHLINMLGEKAMPSLIARLEMRQPHTVCHIMQTMEKQGLIERHHDLDRGNKVRAVLTDKGRKVYELSKISHSITRIMSCLTLEELNQFRKILEKISKAGKEELERVAGDRTSNWP